MTQEVARIEYFATGQHTSMVWQQALLGRVPDSEEASLKGYDLVRIPLGLMPDKVQKMLGKDPDYSIVAPREALDSNLNPIADRVVVGKILKLTRREFALIQDWNASDPKMAKIPEVTTMLDLAAVQVESRGRMKWVMTEVTNIIDIGTELTHQGLEFRNGRKETIEDARTVRKNFFERNGLKDPFKK